MTADPLPDVLDAVKIAGGFIAGALIALLAAYVDPTIAAPNPGVADAAYGAAMTAVAAISVAAALAATLPPVEAVEAGR